MLVSRSEQIERSFQQSISVDQLKALHDRAKVMSTIYCIVVHVQESIRLVCVFAKLLTLKVKLSYY